MKNEELEKYIGELSPELQAKARECKDMDELNALLADNDVELSEDALEAVAGGCGTSSGDSERGAPTSVRCPFCHTFLYYYDKVNERSNENTDYCVRLYCDNLYCPHYDNGLWYIGADAAGTIIGNKPFRFQ